MSHDEMIAVIQAHKEGKVIQYRPRAWPPSEHWEENASHLHDRKRATFNFARFDYRVKPEPREIELEYLGANTPRANFNFSVVSGRGLKPGEKIRVREVIE